LIKQYIIVTSFISLLLAGCSGCSKSGRRSARLNRTEVQNPIILPQQPSFQPAPHQTSSTPTHPQANIVKMEKEDGVYKIPVEVNGVKMYFIFDTGASVISISTTEANFLYKQGKLSVDDVMGTANFSDANGDITEGLVIRLKDVRIGNRNLHDVQATVVGNLNAPLLFGQSALEQFGRISIDYASGEINFE
jgi:aspartyl protease family protein